MYSSFCDCVILWPNFIKPYIEYLKILYHISKCFGQITKHEILICFFFFKSNRMFNNYAPYKKLPLMGVNNWRNDWMASVAEDSITWTRVGTRLTGKFRTAKWRLVLGPNTVPSAWIVALSLWIRSLSRRKPSLLLYAPTARTRWVV